MPTLSKTTILATPVPLAFALCTTAAQANQFNLTIDNTARGSDVTIMIPPTIGHSPALDSSGNIKVEHGKNKTFSVTINDPSQKLKLYVGTNQACKGSPKTNKYGDFNSFLVSPANFTLTMGASPTECSFSQQTHPIPPTPPVTNHFYRQINIGQDYLKDGVAPDATQAILFAGNYVNKPTQISANDPIVSSHLLLIPNKNIVVITENFTPEQFKQIKAPLEKDGHTKVVDLTVFGENGEKVTVPLRIYDGLRSKTIDELIGQRENDIAADGSSDTPYYFEISATLSDFSEQATPIVDLQQYFTGSSQQSVHYAFDASQVAPPGKKPAYNIAHINGIGKVSGADQDFLIKNGQLYATHSLTEGVYQFNIKATAGKEVAYQTFYMNVNTYNPSLSAWRAGDVASTNVLGEYPSIYIYSGENVRYAPWKQEIADYASDLQDINQNFMTQHPIKTAFYETDPYLTTSSDASGMTLNMNNVTSQIQVISAQFTNADVTVTPSYHLAGPLRAIAPTLNLQQKQSLVKQLMKPLASTPNTAGIALDPEGGPNSLGDAQLDKLLADHLAYQGKWLSVYGFADMFTARMDAAFGPLGVANISTYDVGQYRAQETDEKANLLPGSLSMQKTGLLDTDDAPQAQQIEQAQRQDKTCDTVKASNGIISPQSWCNLSANDSMSENNRRWQGHYHHISSEQAEKFFNGKHQLAYPLGASATEWRKIELWKPKLSKLEGGLVMVNQQNQLVQTKITTQDGKSIKMQDISVCGKDVPLTQCAMITATPSRMIDGQLEHSTLADYLQGNLAPYKSSMAHDVGYSVFALEGNNVTDKNKMKTNGAVSEPGYIGWHNTLGTDPAYTKATSDQVWSDMQVFVNNQY